MTTGLSDYPGYIADELQLTLSFTKTSISCFTLSRRCCEAAIETIPHGCRVDGFRN